MRFSDISTFYFKIYFWRRDRKNRVCKYNAFFFSFAFDYSKRWLQRCGFFVRSVLAKFNLFLTAFAYYKRVFNTEKSSEITRVIAAEICGFGRRSFWPHWWQVLLAYWGEQFDRYVDRCIRMNGLLRIHRVLEQRNLIIYLLYLKFNELVSYRKGKSCRVRMNDLEKIEIRERSINMAKWCDIRDLVTFICKSGGRHADHPNS